MLTYFETYNNILGKQRVVGFSFIAEHFMVKKDFMKEVIAAIDSYAPSSQMWVWKIMSGINEKHLSHSGFSEYETYGNFVMSTHPEAIESRSLNSLRRAAIQYGHSPNKYDLHRLSLMYSYASFEAHHRGKVIKIALNKLISFFTYQMQWMKKGHTPFQL